jgi:hypothetical protein
MQLPRVRLLAVVIMGLLCAVADSRAQGHRDEGRLFFEIGMARFDIGGEFDDSILLSTSTERINVPAVLETDGYHLGVGRSFNTGGLSFYYFRANPETQSVLGDEDARYTQIGMDGYLLPLAKRGMAPTITPLLRAGMSFTWLTVENSAASASRIDDASFQGIDGALGVGVFAPLGKVGHVIGEVDKHWMRYGSVSGVGDRIDIEDGLSSSAVFYKVSFSIYLSS